MIEHAPRAVVVLCAVAGVIVVLLAVVGVAEIVAACRHPRRRDDDHG